MSLYQEDVKVINTHAPNKRDLKYLKQNLIDWIGYISNLAINTKTQNNCLLKKSKNKLGKKNSKYIEDLETL